MLLAEELLLLLVRRKAKGWPSFSGVHAALAAEPSRTPGSGSTLLCSAG